MAEKPPILTPILIEMFELLSQVTSLEQHDSMLDDIAQQSPGSQASTVDVEKRKRQFRGMVAKAMKVTGCSEEEGIKHTARYIYGRFVDTVPTDGQTRHG